MKDIRSQLKRNPNVKQINSKKTGLLTLHWNGPSTKRFKTDIAVFENDADWHINHHNWDGIAYHFGIGKIDGEVYQLRDLEARLNHCGVPFANEQAYAVQFTIGEGDLVPDYMFDGLAWLMNYLGIKARHVFGHKEAPRTTACPGALIMRWLLDFREINSGKPFQGTTKFNGNIRDEASVLSHTVGQVRAGQFINGQQVLGLPVKGDALWIKTGNDYIHASIFGV